MQTKYILLCVALHIVLAFSDMAPGYIGCYNDLCCSQPPNIGGSDGRVLQQAYVGDSYLTQEKCIAFCASQGSPYAGVQYSSQCFCGDVYNTAGATNACNYNCAGDSNEICGGYWTNSVFSTSCNSGASFDQSLASSWNDGNGNYFSQWTVTLDVGSTAIYHTEFTVTPAAGQTVTVDTSNVGPMDGSAYSVPSWVYTSGMIPAGDTSYSFDYTTTGTNQATVAISNNNCLPPYPCNAAATPKMTSSWMNGALYQQYDIAVTNQNSPWALGTFDVQIVPSGNSKIYDMYGLTKVRSGVFRCQAYNLNAGGTLQPGCGFTIKTPQSDITKGVATTNYFSIAVVSAVCV